MAAKNILVAGGAGGVGSALVKLLVDRGDTVVTTVLDAQEASAVGARHGDKVRAHIVDLSNADAALIKLKEVASTMGRVDAVVDCAAISPCGPLETIAPALFRKTYEINVIGAAVLYQAFMPALRESHGRIVLMGSMGGRAAFSFLAAYIATKFALEGLCDVMRREAAPQGVAVSLIQPGGIRTNMVAQQLVDTRRELASLGAEQKRLYGYLYEGFLKVAEAGSQTGSSPEQVAAVVLEALDAAEPKSRYVAGEDAKQLLGMLGAMSDKQVDDMFGQMFGG